MSSRAGLRFSKWSRVMRAGGYGKAFGRRFQTTDAAPAPTQNFVQRVWNSPVGVKTVHFWAPVMKWAIVLAGVSDFSRPAEKLSLTQNLALTGTGTIWTRWCFVIRPANMFLASVNFLLAGVGIAQVTRIFLYQQSLKNGSVIQIAENDAKDAVETTKGTAKDPQNAAKKAVE